MKTTTALLIGTLIIGYPASAFAQDAWILVERNHEKFSIDRVANGTISTTIDVGNVASFGESDESIVTLSGEDSAQGTKLTVIDKGNGRVLATWPADGKPARQLAGPSEDVVLVSQSAFYVAIRSAGRALEPNEIGGYFDFYQINLSDGTRKRFPLPNKFHNPRVIQLSGKPLVYDEGNAEVWQFDPADGSLLETVSRADVEDTLLVPKNAPLDEQRAEVSANYIPISGLGLFRLSRFGVLTQVLGTDYSFVKGNGATLDVSSDGGLVRVFSATFKHRPAIGVLRKIHSQLVFAFVDPASMRIEWETTLPAQTVLASIFVSDEGNIFFVDREAGAILTTSMEGTTVFHALSRGQAGFDMARVLSLGTNPPSG